MRGYLALIALCWGLGSMAAKADAIDGEWCAANGDSVMINGTMIRTPGGQNTTGEYGRHFFSYVIPEGEAGSGKAVAMRQLSEEQIMVSEDGGPDVPWERCKPVA